MIFCFDGVQFKMWDASKGLRDVRDQMPIDLDEKRWNFCAVTEDELLVNVPWQSKEVADDFDERLMGVHFVDTVSASQGMLDDDGMFRLNVSQPRL